MLPNNYNEAYHVAGDGVAVPVVRFPAHHIFESNPCLRDQIKGGVMEGDLHPHPTHPVARRQLAQLIEIERNEL